MKVILFVDMLGSRKLWATGGTTASQIAFDRFTAMVVASSQAEPAGALIDGGIENDSAMLVCESAEVALRIAQRLYLSAFDLGRRPGDARLWLRGGVVPHEGNARLRGQAQLNHPLEKISVFPYASCALDAVSIEKSGFKGMRLLLRGEVVSAELRKALRIPFDGHSFIPLRKLGHSGYPKIVQGELLDYLWMATGDDHEWRKRSLQMAARLRFAGNDPDEFIQAAATQVVFHECAAIRQSVRSRADRAGKSA